MQAARLPSMAQARRSHPQGLRARAPGAPALARRLPLPPVPPAAAAAAAGLAPPSCRRRRQKPDDDHPGRTTTTTARAEAAGSSSSSSGGAPAPKGIFARVFAGFDRLPAQTQMVVLTVLGLTAFSVVPFMQPTFLYGNNNDSNNVATVAPASAATGAMSKRARRAADKAAEQARAAAVAARAEAEAAETAKYQRMREVPVAGPVLGYLQDCAMPKKLPDGRTESPGAVRIYLASLILLGVFYAASAVLQGLINLFVAVLVKVGILHVRPGRG